MNKFDGAIPPPPDVRRVVLADGRVVTITTAHGHLVVEGERVAAMSQTEATVNGRRVDVATAQALIDSESATS